MPAELLTAKSLESKLKDAARTAAQKNTRVAISDGNNLMLIVRPNGGASWVLKYRLNGRRTMHALGPWPTVNLAHARRLAGDARRLVIDGRDPVDLRREQRSLAAAEAAAPGATVRDLFNEWHGKLTAGKVYRDNVYNAITNNVLTEIGAKPVRDVTRDDVMSILRKIEQRGSLVMLRRVRMWTAQMFEYEIDHEGRRSIQISPVPGGRLKSFKMPVRGHLPAITDPDEAADLLRTVVRWYRPIIRAALMMSAYTFQRPSEVREAVWSEFDLAAGRWVIPAHRMKEGREHWVPLAPSVVELLRRHQGVVGSTGWLFPSRLAHQPVSDMAINKALKAMGYDGRHCTHGFRATARTILDEHLKVDARFIEKQLSHEKDASGLQGAYNRAQYWDDRVKMMAAWASWIDAQLAQQSSRSLPALPRP